MNIFTNVFGSDGLNLASLEVHDLDRKQKNEEKKIKKIENHFVSVNRNRKLIYNT